MSGFVTAYAQSTTKGSGLAWAVGVEERRADLKGRPFLSFLHHSLGWKEAKSTYSP